ncbi:uncharacterized protein LOC132756710 [Ruditapes philippinarum]|uniref:uncharacterized protein LOC132756710 n=1 Tax=Ruditapes philippinarum TaxID=129788 RepID=UPI00295B8D73|nr:uncharacterized protein LOC132756710 [Ruditapes philippinarum]
MEVRGLFCCQIIVFGIALLVQNCVGFCFRANLMAEMTVSRRLRYYCEYKPLQGSSMRLFPGSNLYLVDQCLDCKCTMDGLQCCGFGHAGGAIAFRKDCKMLLDGCQPLIVKKDNHTLDCFTGKPINITALSEQLPHPDNMYIFETFKTPEQTPAENVTPPVEAPPPLITTTISPNQSASSTSLATPTTNATETKGHALISSTSNTLASTPPTIQETTTAGVPATDAVAITATADQQSPPQNNILRPTFADYLQYLMFTRNTAPDFSGQSLFPPYLNTGSNVRETSFLPAQPPQQQPNNLWQPDYFLPWFWFL